MGSRTRRCLFFGAVALSAGAPSTAATLLVLDHVGGPRSGAIALCTEPDLPERHVAGPDGQVTLPPECRVVECLDADDDTKCGAAELSEPRATCRLEEHVRLFVELPSSACPEGCLGTLVRSSGPSGQGADGSRLLRRSPRCSDGNSFEATVPPAPTPGQPVKLSFPLVRPGRFRLRFDRSADGWSCGTDLGSLQPHPRTSSISVAWRDPARISGRILRVDGKAGAGVPIEISEDPGRQAAALGAWRCETKAPRRGVSDAKGRFELTGIDPAGAHLLVAGSWEDPRGIAVHSVSDPIPRTVTMKLEPPARVLARLVEPGGQGAACTSRLILEDPLAEKLTAALPGSATETSCDPEGRLVLGPFLASPFQVDMRPRRGPSLRAQRPKPKPGATVDLGTIEVRIGDEIQVTVKDEDGAPIEGAEVSAFGNTASFTAAREKAGVGGKARLAGLPPGSLLVIGAKAAGFQYAKITGRRAAESPFTLILKRASQLIGKVVDSWSEGVEGARVHVRAEKSESSGYADTGKDGGFDVDHLSPGEVIIEARAKGYLSPEPLRLTLEEGRTIDGLLLVLRSTAGVRGRVVDPLGHPVSGALVRIANSETGLNHALAQTVTAADGKFRLAQDTQERQVLVATAQGFGPAKLSPVPTDETEEATLKLTEAARLLVHLPPALPPSAQLVVRDGADLIARHATGALRSLAFEGLSPGSGKAWLSLGSIRPEQEYTVELVGGRQVELTFDATGGVEGTVTLDGEPWPMALVTATQKDKDSLRPGQVVFSDERGHYSIDGLAPGPRRMVALASGARGETDVVVPTVGTTAADLVVTRTVLEVQVLDRSSGAPVGGAWIALQPQITLERGCPMNGVAAQDAAGFSYEIQVSDTGCVQARTGETGLAQLAPAQPGSYRLSIGAQRYEEFQTDIELQRGSTPYPAQLTPRSPEKEQKAERTLLRITVDAPESARMGALTCRSLGSNVYSMTMRARRGEYDCGPLPRGPGEAFIRTPGWGTGRVVFAIGEESPQPVTIVVLHGGTLLVPIPNDSTSVPDVRDSEGVSWTEILQKLSFNDVPGPSRNTVPGIGTAWTFADLPPGSYAVAFNGTSRTSVVVESGTTAIAW